MKKPTIAHQDKFTFAGHKVYVQVVEADGYTVELIEGNLEGVRPDFALARIALLQRVIHKLSVDDKEIQLEVRGDGGSQFPRLWDSETRETLTSRLLKLIINNTEPQLADQFPKCFDKYLEEEEETSFTKTSGDTTSLRQVAGGEG